MQASPYLLILCTMLCFSVTLCDEISVIIVNYFFKNLLLPSFICDASGLCHSYPFVQGYFQTLFSCIQNLLSFLNVRSFVLPAADEAKSIWTEKFGFKNIPPEQVCDCGILSPYLSPIFTNIHFSQNLLKMTHSFIK